MVITGFIFQLVVYTCILFYCIRENCSQYAEFSFDLLFEGVEVNKNQYKICRHNGDLFFVIQKIHLEKKYSPSGWLSYPFIELICV